MPNIGNFTPLFFTEKQPFFRENPQLTIFQFIELTLDKN